MAIIMKSSIKITKGFDTWQTMVKAQEDRINEMGIKFLFAGTEKMIPLNFTRYCYFLVWKYFRLLVQMKNWRK